MKKLSATRGFSLADWSLFLRAWFQQLVMDLGLRTISFRRLRDWAAAGAYSNGETTLIVNRDRLGDG